jgi:hypothetical protein
MTNTTRILLTADQWEVVIYNLYRISDACAKTMPDAAQWATEVREILLQETAHPMQEASERAEAMGDTDDV